jgi:hypothetical protein
MGKKQKQIESFMTLAKKYNLSINTFKANIKTIRQKLDDCVGRNNYRVLTPKQVQIIIEHLGMWGD